MNELKDLLLETTKNSFCNECGHNNCVQVVSWVSRPGFTETVPLTSKWIPCEEAETSMDKLISHQNGYHVKKLKHQWIN